MTCYRIFSQSGSSSHPMPRPDTSQGQPMDLEPDHRGNVTRTRAIATMTVTLASAGALQVLHANPYYEGRVQLAGILPPSASLASTLAKAAPTILLADQAKGNIAPPDLVEAAHPSLLQNPQMAETVRANLAQQGIHVTQQALLEQLSAETTPQGWLELHYQDADPNRVRLVLAQVAQWYVAQVPTCDIQACDERRFIQAQIRVLEQQQQEVQQELVLLRQQMVDQLARMGDRVNAADIKASGTNPMDYSIQQLALQHRSLTHYMTQLEQTTTKTSAQLAYLQTKMDLESVKPQSGFALLNRLVPQYATWLDQWQQIDHQLLASHFQGRTMLNREELEQQQTALTTQMNDAVKGLSQPTLGEMAQPIRKLILADVSRYGYLEDWLDTIHRLQLLERRHQTLTHFQMAIATQTEEWRHLHQTEQQLQQNLETATQALATYQQKYAIAQRQISKHELEWQVVAPPEIVQHPVFSGVLLSSLTQLTPPLMTVSAPSSD